MNASGNGNQTTFRVRRHRAQAGLIRVEVEVPTTEDAHAVRRFAQARRHLARSATVHEAMVGPATEPDEASDLSFADLDDARRDIAMRFSHALRLAVDLDMLARGRRIALNFADAVAQRIKNGAFLDKGGPG